MSSDSSFDSTDMESLRSEFTDTFEEPEAAREKKLQLEVEADILTSINGSWNIVSSVGTEEHLERLNPPDVTNFIIQNGKQSFECINDFVTETWSIATMNWRRTYKIGEKKQEKMLITEDNMLVAVYFLDNGEEYARVERFVKDGRLHMVTKRFGMKCTRLYEKVRVEKKMDPEAAKRIAELEAEVEKLKMERIRYTEKLEKLAEHLEKLASEKNDYEDLKEEIDCLTEELEELKVEKAKVDEELRKEKEVTAEILKKVEKQMNVAMNKVKQFEIQLAEKEVLQKRLEEMEEKLKIANEQLKREAGEKGTSDEQQTNQVKDKKVTPIEEAIIGTWKMRSTYLQDHRKFALVFTRKDGHLVETNTLSGKRFVWDLKNEKFEVKEGFYHMFLRDNTLISRVSEPRMNGRSVELERSIEDGLLKIVTIFNGIRNCPIIFIKCAE